MLLFRTARISAHTTNVTSGDDVVCLELVAPRLLQLIPGLSSRAELSAAEAATLGAALLGFAITKGAPGRDYALSAIEQLQLQVQA